MARRSSDVCLLFLPSFSSAFPRFLLTLPLRPARWLAPGPANSGCSSYISRTSLRFTALGMCLMCMKLQRPPRAQRVSWNARHRASRKSVTDAELLQRPLGGLLMVVLAIHVPEHVVRNVVQHHQVFDLAVVRELEEDLLVERLHVLLRSGVHVVVPVLVVGDAHRLGDVRIHVRQEQGLARCRPDVRAVAPVAVPACPDLEVEGAVHAVLLCCEDLLVGHP
eukprot:CAMPEP_0175616166 /NCGR_PEP_ID=MMETSP0096-20121207/65740_1 /TAXON_ID=311494 /ORGANISM="Alexandrium monilatum, Strain CCMP3105" /LENGTH=221 /DNA_ID=CAMNT_0016921317 /DNA_START=47 /DNA_END=708 /DNA_ORIENTATION=+